MAFFYHLNSILVIFILLYSLFLIGSLILKILKFETINLNILTGFSFLIVLVNTLFFFDISINEIRYLLITIILSCLIFTIIKFDGKYFKDFIKVILDQSIIIFFFFLTINLYGEQFYIFRGNHYDTINYTAMSLLSSLYSYSEIINISNHSASSFFSDYSKVFVHDRPTVSIIISLFYLPKFVDLYLVNYIYKIFFLMCIQQSVSYFLKSFFQNFNNLKVFFFSNLFTFSFFSIYIFEIDAYSQLSALSLSIILISLVIKLESFNYSNNFLILLTLISSAFFLIYPEQAIIFFLLISLFLFLSVNKILFKKIAIFLPVFLILTLPSFQIYNFLYKQIIFSSNFTSDWWGYFGAFVLGSKNIILESETVNLIKSNLSDKNNAQILKYIYSLNSNEYGNFFFLNILPSLSGAYYIDIIKNFNQTTYYIISVLLNFLITYFFFINLIYIFKKKEKFNEFNRFLKLLIIFFFSLSIIIIIFSNFWLLIKLFFYFSFFIFIMTILNLNCNSDKNESIKKYNFLLIIFIIFLPIYKFSSYNFGIGTFDSMPSIMKKNYKIDKNLVLDKSILEDCNKIYVSKINKIIDNFVAAKLIYYKKEYIFVDNQKFENKCKV